MIATLRGRLRRKLEDRVVVECGGIGYEVFLPPIAHAPSSSPAPAPATKAERASSWSSTTTRRAIQPRPVLIGFTSDLDKEFFEKLITVKDIGPMVAARALAAPVGELAAAIARQDEKYLRAPARASGPQKAKNIVAQLQAKVAKFALAREGAAGRARRRPRRPPLDADGLREHGVGDPGQAARPPPVRGLPAHHRRARAAARRSSTPEELFDEIYRGQTAR